MKMKTNLLGMFILIGALSGCSSNTESSKSQDEVRVPANTNNNTTENRSENRAPFDYRKMHYETVGVCGEPAFWFKLLAAEDIVIGERDGLDVMVDSRIILHSNQRYEVEINEKYILEYTGSGYKHKKARSRYFSGNYLEQNGKLVLGDFMEVEGRIVDNKIVANVVYKKDVMSRGLANRTTSGSMVYSTHAIKSQRETCPSAEAMLGQFEKFKARTDQSVLRLNALSSDQNIQVEGYTVAAIHLVLESDGTYALLAHMVAPGDRYPSIYGMDSGMWDRVSGQLKLYHGFLSLGFGSKEAVLRFTRNPDVFVNGKWHSIPLTGERVSLSFGLSDLTIDDVTDTYR